MTSIQLSEWQAYDRLEPIGEDRGDFRMAFLSSLIVNISRKIYGKPGAKMTLPNTFIPEWDKDPDEEMIPERQTVAQMKEVMLGIADVQNKRVRKLKALHQNPPRGFSKKSKGFKNKKAMK